MEKTPDGVTITDEKLTQNQMAAIWQTMCVGRQKYSNMDVIYMSLRCGVDWNSNKGYEPFITLP